MGLCEGWQEIISRTRTFYEDETTIGLVENKEDVVDDSDIAEMLEITHFEVSPCGSFLMCIAGD